MAKAKTPELAIRIAKVIGVTPLAALLLALPSCSDPERPYVPGGSAGTSGEVDAGGVGSGGTPINVDTGSGGNPGSGGDPGSGGAVDPGAGTGGTVGGIAGSDGAGGTKPDDSQVMIFDDTRVHDVAINIAPEDWQSIIDDSRGDEWRRATFTYDGVARENVGVRPSGESSRIPGNRRMSVRVKFDAFTGTGKFAGFEELKLDGLWDDGSMMRERISYFLFRNFMPAPREVHGKLTINGAAQGLYAVEEVWDDESIKTHFPAPIGPLYRIRGVADHDPYKFLGMEPGLYVPAPWDAKGMRPLSDHVVIGSFLKVLAESPTSYEQVMNMDNHLSYFACNTMITNTDGFTGAFEIDDHFQYFDPSTGKFFILPWDPDNSWGSINDPSDRSIYKRFSKSVVTLMIRDTYELRMRYKAKLTEIMTKVTAPMLMAEIDRIYEQIKPAVYEDSTKPFPNDHFDWSRGYIKDFATARYAFVQDQVANGP